MPNTKNMGNPALQPPAGSAVFPARRSRSAHRCRRTWATTAVTSRSTPKIYLVLWGWGEPGAFDHVTPGHAHLRSGRRGCPHARVHQGAGRHRLGGLQTQYYQTINGFKEHITNPVNQFGGRLVRQLDGIAANHNDADGLTGLELAQEAQRAAAHFGVTDLKNTPVRDRPAPDVHRDGLRDGAGYCAWHDYTQNQYYPGVQEGLAFTNMPYVLNQTTSCGQNAVNTGYYAGRIDGFTIVVGHEIEETVTDPGAEDVINGVNLGGWYDQSGWENADKCAWVGYTFGVRPAL